MIGILHGYFLSGSGSNLWTRHVCEALCRLGQDVVLICQENHPEHYPFIEKAIRYKQDGTVEVFHTAQSPYPGKTVLHKPQLEQILPVYVGDKYEEFSNPIPMPKLTDEQIEDYLVMNVKVVERVVREQNISMLVANHSVLMPTVAECVNKALGTPYAVIPHGSAIEYAVKKDPRLQRIGEQALSQAKRIFTVSPEMAERVRNVFPGIPDVEKKLTQLGVGVDTSLFGTIKPEKRKSNIESLFQDLQKVDKGKTPALEEISEQLKSPIIEGDYLTELQKASQYVPTNVDEDIVQKLQSVDWEKDSTLLFVGRLIAAKGLLPVLLALPHLLNEIPQLKFIIVGHGPLREVAEAVIHALRSGDSKLLYDILSWKSPLEKGNPENFFTVVDDFVETIKKSEKDYFQKAKKIQKNTVVFTGFLNHKQLKYLYPCCDLSIFPSLVPEAGPMVFLEAMASGSLPMGTYQAGIKEKVDTVGKSLPTDIASLLALRPSHFMEDLLQNVPLAMKTARTHSEELRKVATSRYDWTNIAQNLLQTLRS